VDTTLIRADLDDAEEFLGRFEDRLPEQIVRELHATRERLSS